MLSRFFNVYIVQAAVSISAVMGGGYGNGLEVVEFFTRCGLLGGAAVHRHSRLRIRPGTGLHLRVQRG
jgi:uncharacterized membrane protein YkvI